MNQRHPDSFFGLFFGLFTGLITIVVIVWIIGLAIAH
jgi:hypothetical protein